MGDERRRFLIIGLDGGTFDLLDPLMAAGELPFLKSLVRKGIRAPLRSVYPAKTIPAWYSLATGRDPGELGIFGFTEPGGEPGCSRMVQSFRPAEAIWDRLSRLGRSVGVLNFPIVSGYPVHGFILPGMFSESPATYPRALRGEVESAGGGPYPSELPTFLESQRDTWVAQATDAVARRAKVAAALTERRRPDFLFTLFRETDRLEHQLWGEMSRPIEEIPSDLLTFWRTVDRACESVDQAFRSGGSAVTLVISDHGHGPIESDFLTNRWLAKERFLVFRDGSDLDGRQLLSRMILAAQRLPLAKQVSRHVADAFRRGRHGTVSRLLSGEASFEQAARRIDWQRTVAFSYPVPEGIYLNPANPALTPERRGEVLREIRERLERFPDAHIEVMGPEQIYRGRNLGLAPSLLIRVDGMRTEPRMDFAYATPLIRDRPRFFYGSGTHRMDGILIAAGEGVRTDTTDLTPSLLDIAPTVLEAMGAPAPRDVAGRSFARALGA